MDCLAVLSDRYKEIGQNIRTIMTVYMTWHTFYWTISMVALGWIATAGHDQQGLHSTRQLVANFFGIMSLISSVSSLAVLRAVRGLAASNEVIKARIDELADPDGTVLTLVGAKAWPMDLTTWALWVNTLATVALGVVWLMVAGRIA